MALPFQIGLVNVPVGEQRLIELPLPAFYSHTPVVLPVHVMHGELDGPALFICAAIHGDEIIGVEIVRQLLKKLQPKQINGTLLTIPVVNVYGFVSRSRYLPDRRDLNRSFPGSSNGSMASQLAHTFIQEVASKCTHGIDLHSGALGRENFPQIRASLKILPETEKMAHAFASPVILNSAPPKGALRETMVANGIPLLVYESGEALRFNQLGIRTGVKGIIRVMRHLGMLSPKPSAPSHPPLIAQKRRWVRAPQSGVLRVIAPLGSHVSNGDVIGWIADPFGESEQPVLATISGIIIGRTKLPLVHAGDALFHIAYFKASQATIESMQALGSTP